MNGRQLCEVLFCMKPAVALVEVVEDRPAPTLRAVTSEFRCASHVPADAAVTR